VEEYRQAVIESARLKLIDGADQAVDVLFDLMANSGADNVRLKAATEVLDRNGLRTAEELNVNVEVTETNPAAVLSERLSKLAAAQTAVRDLQRRREEEQEQLALEAADPPTAVLETDAPVIDGEVADTSEE
jgi:hypothetical protein